MAGRPSIDRTRIWQAAADAFLEHGPATELHHVQAAAKIGRSTLHRIFVRRQTLVEELLSQCLSERQELLADVLGPTGETPEATIAQTIGKLVGATMDPPHRGRLLSILEVTAWANGWARSQLVGHRDAEIAAVEAWAQPFIRTREMQELPGAVLHAVIFGPTSALLHHAVEALPRATDIQDHQKALARAAWASVRMIAQSGHRGAYSGHRARGDCGPDLLKHGVA